MISLAVVALKVTLEGHVSQLLMFIVGRVECARRQRGIPPGNGERAGDGADKGKLTSVAMLTSKQDL